MSLPNLAERCVARTGAPLGNTDYRGCPYSEDGAHRCVRDLRHLAPRVGSIADHVCLCGSVWISLTGGVEFLAELRRPAQP